MESEIERKQKHVKHVKKKTVQKEKPNKLRNKHEEERDK